MRKLLEKFLGVKEQSTALVPAKIKPEDNPRLVVVKGEVHFTIYEDGNGQFRARHKSGDWLFGSAADSLISKYEYGSKFSNIVDCQQAAMYFIKSKQLTQVGTIEFIPNRD